LPLFFSDPLMIVCVHFEVLEIRSGILEILAGSLGNLSYRFTSIQDCRILKLRPGFLRFFVILFKDSLYFSFCTSVRFFQVW